MFPRAIRILLIVLLGGVVLAISSEATSFGEELKRESLAELLKHADQHSPMISAARERVKMAETKLPQAISLKDPTFGVKYYNIPAPGWDLSAANMVMYQISQEIPFPLKLFSRREAAEHHLKGEQEMLRMTTLMVHADVKRIYYGLWGIERRMRALQSSVESLKRIARLTEARYRSGTISMMDLLKIQVEAAKLETELETLKIRKEAREQELTQAIGEGANPHLSREPFPELPLLEASTEDLIHMALFFRPEVQIRHHEIIKMRSEYRLATLDWIPDLMFMVEPYTQGGRTVMQDVTFAISFPLWGAIKQRPMSQEMYAKVLEAEALFEHEKNKTRTEVVDAYEKAKGAELRVQVYRNTALPKAEAALRLAERGYESGKISFIDLLDTLRMELMQEVEYAMAVEDLGMNLGHLETIIGQEMFLGGE